MLKNVIGTNQNMSLETETHTVLWFFEIRRKHQTPNKILDISFKSNEKQIKLTFHLVDFTVSVNKYIKIKRKTNEDREILGSCPGAKKAVEYDGVINFRLYICDQRFTRQRKKTGCELDIRGGIKTIDTPTPKSYNTQWFICLFVWVLYRLFNAKSILCK